MSVGRLFTALTVGALLAWWAIPLRSQPGQAFDVGCTLPFEGLHHDIDDQCPREGDPSSSAEGKLQNRFKTNFCATGTSIEVTKITFQALEDAAEVLRDGGSLHFGSRTNLPRLSERPILSDLHITNPAGESVGEGKLVRLVAYLLHADYSGGESVNCNGEGGALSAGHENGDIHVYLSPVKPHRPVSNADRMKQDCRSITAEIIPHFRPNAFTRIASMHDTQSGAKAFDRIAAAKLNRPIRFTGHMFFDGAHQPCNGDGDQTTTPRRFSIWEIHPVYAMDVCKFTTKSHCRVDAESDWTTFEQWMDDIEEDDEPGN
jgi:hypothetical protein